MRQLRNISFLVLCTICLIVGSRETVLAGEGCDTTSNPPIAWIESDGGEYPYSPQDSCNGGGLGGAGCNSLCMANCGTHSTDEGSCHSDYSTGGCGADPACGYWTWSMECECGEVIYSD